MAVNKELKKAYSIAKRDLRRCYTGKGILAGRRRFDDYWARDSFFASIGALRIGDKDRAKKNFRLFLKYQNRKGQLPRRIDRYHVWLKYIGIPIKRKKLRPRYTTSLMYCFSVDQNSLFIIALSDYLMATGDKEFIKEIYKKAKKAMDWNFSNDRTRDYLLEEGFFANWEDTIFWRGQLLYTNVLHCWALKCFAELSKAAGFGEGRAYLSMHRKVRKKINSYFWNGKYYEKSMKRKSRFFPVDANMLAIASGIADRNKAMKILKYMRGKGIDKETPLRSSYPGYPLWRNSPQRLFTLTTGYHNTYGWVWISCASILAMHRLGMKKKAAECLEKLSRKITEFDGVYEVYAGGRPVESLFLTSEWPFAWSAGMFIYTCEKVIGKAKTKTYKNRL